MTDAGPGIVAGDGIGGDDLVFDPGDGEETVSGFEGIAFTVVDPGNFEGHGGKKVCLTGI